MKACPTILVVDDDPADQFLMQEAMKMADLSYTLKLVSDGDEAIEYLYRRGRYADPHRAPRPDLVLLDLRMPRFNGRQVAQTIKTDPNLKSIPVIVLSTSSDPREIDELYQIGINTYIQKPVNFDDFTAALRDFGHYWLERAALPGCG